MALSDHLPNHLVDRLLADAMTAEEALRAKLHLEDCSACALKVQHARQEREAFLSRNPPAARVARLREVARPRRWFLRWPALALPALAAATAALVLVPSFWGRDALDDALEVRAKGSAGAFVIRRGESRWLAQPTETLREGDAIEPLAPQGRDVVAFLLALDAQGRARSLTRPEQPSSLPTLTLDSALEPERLLLVVTQTAISLKELCALAEASFGQAGGELPRAGERLEESLGGRANVTSLLVLKR